VRRRRVWAESKTVNVRVVVNVHERVIPGSVDAVGRMIDTLGSAGDVVWPTERWPALKLDRPLQVGAAGVNRRHK